MLTFNKRIDNSLVYPIYQPYNINEIIYFDIETTGFSPKTSIVYLIGCMYHHKDSWYITQWLLDDPKEEENLLLKFADKVRTYKRIIHYNGSGFDIPYLVDKYNNYKIDHPFSSLDSFDLYKNIIPYKKLFPFPNLKLQTLQNYLGFIRKDKQSGGQLINVYSQYIGKLKLDKLRNNNKSSYEIPPSTKDLQDILLLHNYDDVVGMLEATSILLLVDIFKKGLKLDDILEISKEINETNILLRLKLNKAFPYKLDIPLDFNNDGKIGSDYKSNENDNSGNTYNIQLKGEYINITCPLVKGKLKYFFDNYKDYYYLPLEDSVIHKSLATYVDKEYRIKAKPSNCYTTLDSVFIPVSKSNIFKENDIKTFKTDFKSATSYVELANIISSKENIILWCNSLLKGGKL